MLDDPPEVLGSCLKMLGYSLTSADPTELKEAQAEAIAQKRLVRAYLNAEVRDQLVAGDVTAAQAWAVTAAQAIQAAPGKLAFAFPSEGFRALRGHDGHPAGKPASGGRAQIPQLPAASRSFRANRCGGADCDRQWSGPRATSASVERQFRSLSTRGNAVPRRMV